MKRKSLKLQSDAELLKKQYEEAQERVRQQAEEEERERTEITELIKSKCGNKFFCGIILTQADLINILGLMLQSGESVSVPFKLYFNDKEDESPQNAD